MDHKAYRHLTQAVLFTFIFNQLFLGVFISYTNLEYFEFVYAREDGLIEWLTVLALLCGCLLNLKRGYDFKNSRRSKLVIASTLFLAFLYFFGAGEEISWGQRLFDIQAPEYFQQNNSQGETNLHNLVLGGVKINKLIFGQLLGLVIALYFLVLPLCWKKGISWARKFVEGFAIPLPRPVHIICYLILFLTVQLVPSSKKGELLEFGGCWIFFAMNLFPLNIEFFKQRR